MTTSHFKKQVYVPYIHECNAFECTAKIQPGQTYIVDADHPSNFYCSWECSETKKLNWPDELTYTAPQEHCGAKDCQNVLLEGQEYYLVDGTYKICCDLSCAEKEFNIEWSPYEPDRANLVMDAGADRDYRKQKKERWK